MPMLYFDNIKTTLKALLSANVNANVITILDTSWLPVSLGAEETFKMVLIRGREYEVVRVTAINPDKTLTVVRAQDGTTVKEWPGVETEIINAPLASDHAFFQSLQKRENHTGKQDVSTIEGLDGAIAGKVDKVAGKGLSTEDFSSADKTKLNGIAVNATANATDADLRDRTKHTGITPITGGGTGADTLAVAQANLNVPTRTGGSASGTWGINVTGTSGGAPWSGVSGKPTTLAGYGITNGMPLTGGRFTGHIQVPNGQAVGYGGDPGGLMLGGMNGAATMSMHNGGYALNMGLDTDTVFRIGGWSQGSGSYRLHLDTGGNLTAGGNVTAYSDRRLKKDFEVIKHALHKLKQLTGYNFTRIDTGERQTGLVAQDVKRVSPEAVNQTLGVLTVAYGNLMGLVVEAIKEIDIRMEKIERKLNNGNA